MAGCSILNPKTLTILGNDFMKKWDQSRQENVSLDVCLVLIPIDHSFGIFFSFKQHPSRLSNGQELGRDQLRYWRGSSSIFSFTHNKIDRLSSRYAWCTTKDGSR